MASLPPESMLSHYRIKELVAKGGMGEVYKAVDVLLGRVVAIKVPAPFLAENDKARRRFLREARSASILSHPNICTIHEVGQEGELNFIVMEYVEGETIKDLLVSGPIAVDDALAYALQIADALEEAHRNGVVHRDIKPSNITVNRRGQAVVLDFGLAKQLDYAGMAETDTQPGWQAVLTVDKSILGTIPYMSPEQLQGEEADARSDIFSFGVLCYEMLTGRRPFAGDQDIDVMHAIVHDDPVPPSRLRPEVDPAVDLIIARSIQKSPAERFQSVAPLKRELAEVVRRRAHDLSSGRTVGERTHDSTADRTSSLSAVAQTPRYRWPIPLAALMVASLGVAAKLLWWSSPPPPPPRVIELARWKDDPMEQASEAKFSRDGGRMVFVSRQGGDSDLWVKPLSGGEKQQLTSDKWRESSPVWSPDDSQIAFVSNRENQTGIYTLALQGGSQSLLSRLESPAPVLVSWGASGRIYFEWRSNLYSLNPGAGQPIQLTTLDASRPLLTRAFAVSRDERRLAYVESREGATEIWVSRLDGGDPARLTSAAAPSVCRTPLWHPDGRRLIYGSNVTDYFQIYAIDSAHPGDPMRLTQDQLDYVATDVSPDGGRILIATTHEEAELWRARLDSGAEAQLTSGGGVKLWPEVSPDGQRLAYLSNSAIRGKLTSSRITVNDLRREGAPVQLAADGFDPAWSPDSNRLAFLRFSGGKFSLWTVKVGDRSETQLPAGEIEVSGHSKLPSNRLQTAAYSWSPDGEWIVYCSRKAGPWNVWRISADGSRGDLLTDNTSPETVFSSPLWSPDGRRVAFISTSSRPVAERAREWRVGIWDRQTKETTVVLESGAHQLLRLLGWSPSGRELILAASESKENYRLAPTEVGLLRLSLAERREQLIGQLPSAYFYNLHLAPDGRSVAFVAHRGGKDSIWLSSLPGGGQSRVTGDSEQNVYLSSLSWSPDGRELYYSKQVTLSAISMLTQFQ